MTLQPDETWSDDDPASGRTHQPPPPGHAPVVQVNELDAKRHAHKASMQNRVLAGVGLVFLTTLVVIVTAVSLGGITEEFATELAKMILPVVLTSGGSIVVALFVTRDRDRP